MLIFGAAYAGLIHCRITRHVSMEVHGNRFALAHVEPSQSVPKEHMVLKHNVVGLRACRDIAEASVVEVINQRQCSDIGRTDVLDDNLEAHRIADHSDAVNWHQQYFG